MVKDSIFVAVVAADELYLTQTIKSLFSTASGQTRIHVGICVQDVLIPKQNIEDTEHIDVVRIEYKNFFGVGTPRQIALSLISGQDYCLMIDGHMIFEQNWDLNLIKLSKEITCVFDKNVISGRTMNWYFDENRQLTKHQYGGQSNLDYLGLFLNTEVSHMSPSHKHGQPAVSLENRKERQVQITKNKFVVRQDVVSCNFLFGKSEIFDEVMPDSKIIYTGDESTIGLRLLTRGYEILTPDAPIAYHLLKQADVNYSHSLNWQPYHPQNKTSPSYWLAKRHFDSLQRVKEIFTGKILGEWGAPSLERLSVYEQRIGTSFKDFYQKLEYLQTKQDCHG